MVRAEYVLSQPLTHRPDGGGPDADIEFPKGTSVTPFWNQTFLPQHIMDKLEEDQSWADKSWGEDANKGKLVMCLIGSFWISVPLNIIRRSY